MGNIFQVTIVNYQWTVLHRSSSTWLLFYVNGGSLFEQSTMIEIQYVCVLQEQPIFRMDVQNQTMSRFQLCTNLQIHPNNWSLLTICFQNSISKRLYHSSSINLWTFNLTILHSWFYSFTLNIGLVIEITE